MNKGYEIANTIREFVTDRNTTFINAVKNDDWDGVRAFMTRHGITAPEDETVLKAGVYKAVQSCTMIPEDVKKLAARKCVALGFWPFIGT